MIALIVSSAAVAQAQDCCSGCILFNYDGSGNRIKRYYQINPMGCRIAATEEEAKATAAKLYPNPTEGQLSVQLSEAPAGRSSFEVVDAQGRLLLTQPATASLTDFDLRQYPAGAYWLLLRTEQKVIQRWQVIKQ